METLKEGEVYIDVSEGYPPRFYRMTQGKIIEVTPPTIRISLFIRKVVEKLSEMFTTKKQYRQ